MNLTDYSFFQAEDVVEIAKNLLGKTISVSDGPIHCTGIISETEAYAGPDDKASHAYGGRYTERTKTMYLSGGHCYVYLCYGIHKLFNIVTNKEGIPHAVLIRGAIPMNGVEHMQKRRKVSTASGLANGPGKFSQAFGIEMRDNAIPLQKDRIRIYDTIHDRDRYRIEAGPRVGIDYAEEHKDLPWRFRLIKV